FRPGDVLRAMNGTTIEVGNTDAEGRLTLADALCYATARVKPDEMIDMATLTGACVVALGPLCAGLLSNDAGLAKRLLEAAGTAGEGLWQLPLIEEYREHLKSEIADLNNVGPRGGGAINDHDSTDGLADALDEARLHPPLRIVAGLEINCDVQGGADGAPAEIHVLGYEVEWEADWFQQFLRAQREERRERVYRMAERLGELGMPIDPAEVLALVKEGSAGRPHVAR